MKLPYRLPLSFSYLYALDALTALQMRVRAGRSFLGRRCWLSDTVLAWGRKPSAAKAEQVAAARGLPLCYAEDGFVRSFAPGKGQPPLSLVLDELGIYYDAGQPSALERLLAGPADVLQPSADVVQALRLAWQTAGLSKYNHAPDLRLGVLRAQDKARVLVVDQTAGDLSLRCAAAGPETFAAMLQAALTENPEATVYVKTHPEVSSGAKQGHYSHLRTEGRVVLLREAVHPPSLLPHFDKVYVATSTMGFEALLLGRAVVCFGLPWYAGWGVTDDRAQGAVAEAAWARRSRQRSVDELFAAAYLHHSHYLNPYTHKAGRLADVLPWLQLQRRLAQAMAGASGRGRLVVVGFEAWRRSNMRPALQALASMGGGLHFVRTAQAAQKLQLQGDDQLLCWGRVAPAGLEALAAQTGVRLLRMEDGFMRSVGLGSDLIAPASFVVDGRGIYFDPSQPSDLEQLLNTHSFSAQDRQRAEWVRGFIVRHGISKYNLDTLQDVSWRQHGRTVVLVPGQVEDDASIRFGCDTEAGVHSNLGLLQAARQAYPDAFIVYKPHPDVSSGNRRGKLALAQARAYADHIESEASIASCLAACDGVATMTSLTGFDALLRGKWVRVYGRPFYAGWGLTQDELAVPRRQRQLSLDELVAGALLHYPLYWDAQLKGYTNCEAVLRQLLAQRLALQANGGLEHLRTGWWRRLGRKLAVLLRAYTGR